jgi:hypothetical protein
MPLDLNDSAVLHDNGDRAKLEVFQGVTDMGENPILALGCRIAAIVRRLRFHGGTTPFLPEKLAKNLAKSRYITIIII